MAIPWVLALFLKLSKLSRGPPEMLWERTEQVSSGGALEIHKLCESGVWI